MNGLIILWNVPEIWNYLDINFEDGFAPLIFYCLPWPTIDTRAAYSSQWDFFSLFIFICIFSRNHPNVRSGTIYIYTWANYNNSPTWIKAIWEWFPLLTMIPVRSQWGRYNLPRYIYICLILIEIRTNSPSSWHVKRLNKTKQDQPIK